ncbi:MAG TPA: MFS transporter [Opitutaceae bacterium]
MRNWRLTLSLFLNYFVFAILLNSVGTVIFLVQRNYGVSASAAGVLEACKDLSIAVVSFFIASLLTVVGYKRAMLGALAFVTAVLLLMPVVGGFVMMKLLFVAIGISFALIKVSTFAAIALVTRGEKAHASFMSFLESFFMMGILCGYFLFGAFADDANPQSTEWLQVYYLLAGVTAVAFVLLLGAEVDESVVCPPGQQTGWSENFSAMFRLAVTPLSLVFIASVFLYVLIEQAIMSWLPTFNSQVLNLPAQLSIQMAAILPASTALGRFCAGFILKRVAWFPVLVTCLVVAVGLVLLALPLAQANAGRTVTGWSDAPLAAWIFPLIGFCLAPIYPTINSAELSALPPAQHGRMSGLIVIFSALGGSTGSLITGRVFEDHGGQVAFYLSLVPIGLLLLTLFFFNRLRHRKVPGGTGTPRAKTP